MTTQQPLHTSTSSFVACGLLVLSLGASACVTEDPELEAAYQASMIQPIVLPHSGTGQDREVMSSFSPLVVKLHDTDGEPIVGATVQFSAPASGATAWFKFDGFVETDENGRAEITPSASSVAGTYLVQAYVYGADPVPFVLTNTAAPPAAILPAGGTNQAMLLGQPFPAALSVAVYDNYGNPVEGVPVTFTAPTTEATAELAESGFATTDGEGRASVYAFAGGVEGTYEVIANVPGAPAIPFVLSNVTTRDLPDVATAEQTAELTGVTLAP
jgi:hypothetical protein